MLFRDIGASIVFCRLLSIIIDSSSFTALQHARMSYSYAKFQKLFFQPRPTVFFNVYPSVFRDNTFIHWLNGKNSDVAVTFKMADFFRFFTA